ncbi:MAG: right-handed parallel beta-helix repeat-containing protein [Spirochaetales bacterium]|nr:right-handed parallel beta-helix repeat-containing protein [Spirochaetales bacterium]
MKSVLRIISILIGSAVILFTGGCDSISTGSAGGEIQYVDFTGFEKIYNNQEGILDFGGKPVGTGDRAIQALKIKNIGAGDLIINNISLVGAAFSFVDGKGPGLPLLIPEGKTINDIFIEFSPDSGGDYEGKLFVEREGDTDCFDLTGQGLWLLTLTVAGSGDDSYGAIRSPVNVTAGNSVTIALPDAARLSCEINDFFDLSQWSVLSNSGEAPVFENQSAKDTEVILKSHTEITLDILQSFVIVPDNTASIQSAIDTCSADSNLLGVIVRTGTYNQNFTMKAGAPLYGGYASSGSARDYKNRTLYQTIVNGSIGASGSVLDNSVLLEGFIINGHVSYSSGAGAGIQHNTINGQGGTPALSLNSVTSEVQHNIITGGSAADQSTALFVTGRSVPRLLFNEIHGGTTTADYSKVYVVRATEGAAPVLYGNTISGGTAAGAGSESFAVFNDFECEPLLRGNSISGGSAPGADGRTYGIYMVNNGKAVADYNEIDGGDGYEAFALYGAYGANFYLSYNNIFTSSAAGRRYGVYLGAQGRVRLLTENGLYGCPDSMLHTSIPDTDITDIEAVNDYFHTDTNRASAISYTIPEGEPIHE